MNRSLFLYLIIFIEGYVVLSAELLAIRQLIPFTGSGTDTVSIIIAAVLMPLAIGYYTGGQFKKKSPNGQYRSVRKKLLTNILISAAFLLPGLSYVTIDLFFQALSSVSITNRLATTTLYSLIFLVVPVFLLAQTIPLVSHFFRKETLSQATGKMLSFSTIGSFMGAVFSTLILMSFLGVFNTVIITLLCLAVLFFMLTKKKLSKCTAIMTLLGVLAITLNSSYVMNSLNIIEANRHHTVRILNLPGQKKVLSLNNNLSSAIYDNKSLSLNDKANAFKYIKYIDKVFLGKHKYIGPVKSILVIGAGGFTIGLDDRKNEYTFLDIDHNLKRIAEENFLKRKLTKNKKFLSVPARGFLHQAKQDNKQFDLVILDAYLGAGNIPEHLVTQEFFLSVKDVIKKDGILIMNFIGSPTFNNAFSIHLNNTLHSVFPLLTRQVMQPYDAWLTHNRNAANMLYIYNHRANSDDIYTDNKNQTYLDKEAPVQ